MSAGADVRKAADATRLGQEAAEAPAVVRAQLGANEAVLRELARRLRAKPPRAVVTLGRGSSDHAATFARYLIETRLGVITASAPPSIASVYDATPAMEGALCLAISQSGRSPDLLASAEAARNAGALVVALVNDAASPLAQLADVTIPLLAGPELSVAATKTYIGALSAIVQLVAHWSGDARLLASLAQLPELLDQAWAQDWSPALPLLTDARSLYVLGRGVGFGVAEEAALKLKETCGVHAEAFSAAEVRHGPMALVGPDFPVLAFAQNDETRAGVEAALAAAAAQGAPAIKAGGGEQPGVLTLPTRGACPVLEPIAYALSFYRLVAAVAVARGLDPDRPPHLSKITETL
ncbi:MAG TPA: SIS domain-containing protein [Caulobacteraceae bacterium]|nr:SIS domain-containing protein [Caulobacteraceae bacterium]